MTAAPHSHSGIVRYIPIREIEAWIQQGWQVSQHRARR